MEFSDEDWKLIHKFDKAVNILRDKEMQESTKCFEGLSDDMKLSYMRGRQMKLPEGIKAPELKNEDIPDSVLCDVSTDDIAQKNYLSAVSHYLSWQYKGSDFRLEFGSEKWRAFVTRSDGTFMFYFKNKEKLVGMVIDGQTGYVEGCMTRIFQNGKLVQEHILQFKRTMNKQDYICSKRKHNINFNGSYTKALQVYKVELSVGKLRRVIDDIATYRPKLDNEPSAVSFQTLILYSAEAPRIRGVLRITAKSLSPLELGIQGLAVIRIPESEEPFVLNYKQLSYSALDSIETGIFKHVPGTTPRNLFQILSSVVLLRRRKVYPTRLLMPDAPPDEKDPDEHHSGNYGLSLEEERLRSLNKKGTLYSTISHGGEKVYRSEIWIDKLWEYTYSTKYTNLNKLIEKDPNKAVPLFWAAINSGDRIESALKDMANVLKQANRAEQAVEAIRSFCDHYPYEAQESLDNILLNLYKKCGRTEEQIEMLMMNLIVNEELASGHWEAKLSKSQERVASLSLRDEKARLLGNLAWAYMQSENYEEAEMLYRQALATEADYNKECNLAICLMKTGKLAEAKYLVQAIPYNNDDESHVKSLSWATEMLRELELQPLPSPITQVKCKGSGILLAADMEKLEDLHPRMLSTPLTQLKYEEPHISVLAERQKHEDCNARFPSSITQLKREEPYILVTASGEKIEHFGEYQDLSRLFNDAATPQSTLKKLRKRLVKEAPKTSTHDQILTPAPTEGMPNSEGTTDASENPVQERKLLADMVDEDEQQLGDDKTWAGLVGEETVRLGDEKPTVGLGHKEQNECSKHGSKLEHKTSSSSQGLQRPFASDHLQSSSVGSWKQGDSKISTDKNVNWELVRTAPMWRHNKLQDYSNRVRHKPNSVYLNEKASGTKQLPWRSIASQHELFPDSKSKCDRPGHGFVPFRDYEHTQCSSHTEATHRRNNSSSTGSWRPQNCLRVFQEITNEIKQNVA